MASVQRRPDGRWRARYRDKDSKEHSRHFTRKIDAIQWLDAVGNPLPARIVLPPPRPAPPPRPHVLYRFRDGDGMLLYVGITAQGAMRWSSHRITASWWPDVRRVDVEHFPDLSTALAAERDAIRTEGPLYNIMHALMINSSAD